MSFSRRKFAIQATAALAATHLARAAEGTRPAPAPKKAPAPDKPVHDMSKMPKEWMGNEQVAMLLYPGFTAQDLIGPQYMFASMMGAKVHLVAQTKDPVTSDTGVIFVPTATFATCPRQLDILFCPGGGEGTLKAMENRALIDWVAERGRTAKLVTSVCTGSLILGTAGLLKGYRATSHWVARDILRDFGAIPVEARYVKDRNRITGAGVTAGLDFGLQIVADLRGKEYAQTVQLLAEYAPAPPLNAGTPRSAPPQVKKTLDDMFVQFVAKAKNIATASTGRRP